MQLLKILIRREITSRYLRTAGGLIWAIVMPLMLLAIYAFVFTRIFDARFPGQTGADFVGYLALGLWPWIAFSESLSRATTAITENEAIIGKVALPHHLLVQASVCATFSIHVVGFVVIAAALAVAGLDLNWYALPWALWTFGLFFLWTMGLSYFAAATQVYVRDVVHALPAVLMLFFFATPILYPESLIPEAYRTLMGWNPFATLLRPIREGMLAGVHHASLADGVALLASLAVVLLGRAYFTRLSRRFEDYL